MRMRENAGSGSGALCEEWNTHMRREGQGDVAFKHSEVKVRIFHTFISFS